MENDQMNRIVRGISLPLGDTHFEDHLKQGPEFAGKGTYQFAKIELALAATEKGKRRVALDIGGHIGLWARVLAHSFARVVSLEPLPALHPHFKFNTADCENVTLVPFAAGAENGEVSIVTVAENSGNGFVMPDGHAQVVHDRLDVITHKTQAVTIDSLNYHDVDLIKIDVEGWELQVIHGAQRTIRRDWPVMVVEQKPGNAERYGTGQTAAVNLLKGWGYEVAWTKSGDWCLKHKGVIEA